MPNFGNHIVTSFISEYCYIFTWTIRNFSSFDGVLQCPILSLFYEIECSCSRQRYPPIEFKCTKNTSSNLTCEFIFADISGNILLQQKQNNPRVTQISKSGLSSFNYAFFGDYRQGMDYKKLNYLPCDTLVFTCRLSVPKNSVPISIDSSKGVATNPASYLRTLATKVQLQSDDLKNQKINLCIGNEITTVNKSLLCASSPVFEKMFQNKMREEKQNTVTIEDITMPTLQKFIDCLCTGNVPDEDVEFLCNLYYVIDKYDVAALRDGCRNMLQSKMTVDNVTLVLKLASTHNDESLKSCALAFLGVHLNSVLETKGWRDMMRNETRIALEAITDFYPVFENSK